MSVNTWEDEHLNLKDNLLRGIFAYGFEKPSPIQKTAVPTMISESKNGERKDINPLIVEYEGNSWEDYPDPNYDPNKVDSDKKNTKDPRFYGPPNTFTK